MMRPARFAASLALLVCVGCGPDEPLRIDTIQLGRSLNPDNSVANHTTSFKADDTSIYVSVLTPAAGSGTIRVRWTYAGRVVSEPTKEVSYNGPAATEFHIVDSAGFPAGDYKVEVFLNGAPAGERTFRVDK
jgi:hypothetical protein